MLSAVIVGCVLFAGTGLPQTGAAGGYCWPLDLPRQLTSSFAEYRPGRFHAGIDLRTQGVGRPVHVADDGWVARVRCSPWGYGKAVYVHLKDGHTAVYAHLDDYDDALRTYVRQVQHARKSYEVDLYPEAKQFPVIKGQVIAKSGQTGIGAPHLHYELRDAAQQPVNLRHCGVDWPDKRRPRIKRLVVTPWGPEATVNGDLLPVVFDVTHRGNGEYTCPSIQARGRITFGVDTTDPGDGGYGLGVHELRLVEAETTQSQTSAALPQTGATLPQTGATLPQTGATGFVVRHDVLSYDNHRNAAVAYHPYLLDEGHFLSLWRWPGNVCASYAHSSGDGVLAVDHRDHVLRIAAIDFFGNEARLAVMIRADTSAAPAVPTVPGAGRGQVSLDCGGDALIVSVRFDKPEPEKPTLKVNGFSIDMDGASLSRSCSFRRIGPTLFRARFAPDATAAYTLHVQHPRVAPYERSIAAAKRGAPEQLFDLAGVRLHVASNSPYGTLLARCEPISNAPPIPSQTGAAGARRCGAAYRVWPDSMPIDVPVELAFPMPEEVAESERLHVYRWLGSSWRREDTVREAAWLKVKTRAFGIYTVLEDVNPPVITNVSPPEGYCAKTRRPHVYASVQDTCSGIAHYTITCGGAWLLAAFDPERGRIAWERDEDLAAGTQEVAFCVTDAAGNVTTVRRTVTIPAG